MSSPSSRVAASSSKIRSSRRDVNPSASRSRAFGASSVSNSSRQVAGAGNGGRSSARVYLDGVDVTPQSLLVSRIKPSSSHDQRGAQGKGKGGRKKPPAGASVAGASVLLSSDHFSTSSIDDSDSDAPPSSSASSKPGNQEPVAKPVAKPPPPASSSNNQQEDDDAGQDTATDTASTAAADALAPKLLSDIGSSFVGSTVSMLPVAAVAKPAEKKERRPVTILMAEAPTEMLFTLRSVCVAQDAPYHQAIAQRNRAYLEACAAKKGSDKFVHGRSQTLQLAQKTKEVMTAPPATRDSACMATDWDIFDCARVEDDSNNDHEDGAPAATADASSSSAAAASAAQLKTRAAGETSELGDATLKQQVHEIVDATTASPGCMLDVDGDIVEDLKARQHALRHAKKHHRHGNSSTTNSHKSRVVHSNTNARSSQDVGRSSANVGNSSSSSMASPSQSSGNASSFGASQDVVGLGGGGEDSGASNSMATASQVNLSGASRVFSNGSSDDGKAGGNHAYARANANVDLGQTIVQQRTAKVLASASLLKTVSVVERAVQQNVYHQQHVLYRNFPSLAPPPPSSSSSGVGSEAFRKERHDWRAGLGLSDASSSSSSSSASSAVVPPIGSFTAVSAGGPLVSARAGKEAALEQLWSFTCCLTQGRTVTCLAWNSVNEDLLAVAYAKPEAPPSSSSSTDPPPSVAPSSSADDGLVLFWSLKNPEYPERIYNLDVGVTSIDFSRAQPYLLAVGFANGVVAIYDTRKDDLLAAPPSSSSASSVPSSTAASRPPSADMPFNNTTTTSKPARRYVPLPVASSETSSGKHLDAVWQVKWISKGSDRGEHVVSISSDGRVTEWSMKKGLSFSDLMTLKRVANPLLGSDNALRSGAGDSGGGVISRQASGHCIDFAPHDPSVYYVGTEDGIIHKCSVSYNEQYLETYFGHTGPVYQILVSPFSSDLFLSCAADWTVKLWHQSDHHQQAALTFKSVDLQHAVLGVSWCPSHATMFGAVAEDGRIEIWDLQHSSLDPILTHFPKKYAPAGESTSAKPATTGLPPSTAASGGLDSLDDLSGVPKDAGGEGGGVGAASQPREIPLACTKIAFAPSAPVIVVGDSTGDVTVYRVPALTGDGHSEPLSHEEQIARLHRAMNPNSQP